MTHRYPIFIPSKGRPDQCCTAPMLDNGDCHYRFVVEPQDHDGYAARYGEDRVLTLPQDDPGHVAFARNWIKSFAHDEGYARHWQMDDDVRWFERRVAGKHARQPAGEALRMMEDFVDRYTNVKIAAPGYATWAWSSKVPFALNGLCASALLIEDDPAFEFRRVNEDIDYCIQVLAAGFCTIMFRAIAIEVVSSNSESSVQYDSIDKRVRLIRKTQQLWPGLGIELQAHGGRIRTSKVWRKFKTPLVKREGAA